MLHEGFTPEINDAASVFEGNDEIDLQAMKDGSVIQFKTLNSTYTCKKAGEHFEVEGGRFFYEPTPVHFVGSKLSFFGSMIKVGWCSVGGYAEFYVKEGPHKGMTLTTTEIQSVRI